MILTDPRLEEKEQKGVIEFVKKFIESSGGEVISIDSWGKRSTAYPIKHYLEAYYDIMYYKLEAKKLPELERRLKLKESVLRYLNLRSSEQQINLIRKREYAPIETKAQPENINEAEKEEKAIIEQATESTGQSEEVKND
jgi:small subunit ribosomal protein S6